MTIAGKISGWVCVGLTACGVVRGATAHAQPILSELEEAKEWSVIASDGVTAAVSHVPGIVGDALRLDFDFRHGSGFCIARRPLDLALPENYRIRFHLRGAAPANNFEFKLVSSSGDDVWWVNKRQFDFPPNWAPMELKARHFTFAWGPSGGVPLKRIGAIEIAVAAGSGGRGGIELDGLSFEEIPPRPAEPIRPSVRATRPDGISAEPVSTDDLAERPLEILAGDPSAEIRIDFGREHEFGGLTLDWDRVDFPTNYTVELLGRPGRAEPFVVAGANGGRDFLPMPDAEGTGVIVRIQQTQPGRGAILRGVRLEPLSFGESANAMFERIAVDSPRGNYPAYFLGRQTAWTVVGVPDDDDEALIDVFGAVEVDKLSFRLEPFLRIADQFFTWADVTATPTLEDDVLPIPSVTWRAGDFRLKITAFADGPPGKSILVVLYRLTNTGERTLQGNLFLTIRPFQVLPPWQNLNSTGGVASIPSVEFDGSSIRIGTDKIVSPFPPPAAVGASGFTQGDIVEDLRMGRLPARQAVTDPHGLASAVMTWPVDLAPGQSTLATVQVPFHGEQPDGGAIEERLRRAQEAWREQLQRVRLRLPEAAQDIAHTFATVQAHILINRDGPAIQPGSRTYDRSWIRDGALTSTALLATGHTAEVREFLDWYAPFQYESGKIPCVLDDRGPDPVAEHDSHGQYIHAVSKYFRFTHDVEFLARHYPRVKGAVAYIESLRKQRMTDEYRDGPPEKRACFGLVPESISHEGYSAKPMHSYWDSFFVLQGLKEAVYLARTLADTQNESRWAAMRDEYREALYRSMRTAMAMKAIDFIPGCVELGDFDATSTAIGVFPCGERDHAPRTQLLNTFDRYYRFFLDRRDGTTAWEAYTPYETRLVGTFVFLDRPDRAHELLRFFLADRRPRQWNQWGEVVWRDADAPKFIGDMPHTWVGSDFLNSVRSMFVYERESDSALVLGAGVLKEWLADPPGLAIEGFPTEYGTVGYQMKQAGPNVIEVELRLDGFQSQVPLVLHTPSRGPVRRAECEGAQCTLRDRQLVLTNFETRVRVMLFE